MSGARAPKKIDEGKIERFSPLVAFGLTPYYLTLSPAPERLEQAIYFSPC